MKRTVTGILAATAVALVAGACGDTGYAIYGPEVDPCSGYTSCASCTPVVGCGWCFASGATGSCSSDSSTCAVGPASWTWNPSGCTAIATPTLAADAGSD